jgi:SAM-dependent methyltransferase
MPQNRSLPGPYDKCYCPSGKKYKYCHYQLDVALPAEKRVLSQKMYSDRWGQNADHFRAQGCYKWMASCLSAYSPRRILDVGCGHGTGVIALKAACGPNAQIISCDDNLQCLEKAQDEIRRCGLDVEIIQRLVQVEAVEDFHRMAVLMGRLDAVLGNQITLIEADILWDIEFLTFLDRSPKFDAVTVWLIGTHDLKPECKNIDRVTEPGHYRLMVQNRIYAVADRILRDGGALQVVDRGEVPTNGFLKEDHIQSHREQAQGTSLRFEKYEYVEYEEPANGAGVTMQVTVGTSGRAPNVSKLAMVSVISVKSS